MAWELRHLRYFSVVAEELHFGRAAIRLHIAQPALSRQIQSLETALGVQLFERTKRTVRLTVAGQFFLEEARGLLHRAAELSSETQRVNEGRAGRLRLGFIASAAYSVMPTLLPLVRSALPGVRVELQQLRVAAQLDALRMDELDAAIVRPPIVDPTIATELLIREPLVAALPAHHALRKWKQLSIEQLRDESFIMVPSSRGPFLEATRAFCHAAGFEPRIVQEATEMPTVIGLVSAGIGISLVPASSNKFHIAKTIYRPVKDAPHAETLVAYLRANPLPLLPRFIQIAREIAHIP